MFQVCIDTGSDNVFLWSEDAYAKGDAYDDGETVGTVRSCIEEPEPEVAEVAEDDGFEFDDEPDDLEDDDDGDDD